MPTANKPCCVKRAQSKNPRYCEFCGAAKSTMYSADAPQLDSKRDRSWVRVFMPHLRKFHEHQRNIFSYGDCVDPMMKRRFELTDLVPQS